MQLEKTSFISIPVYLVLIMLRNRRISSKVWMTFNSCYKNCVGKQRGVLYSLYILDEGAFYWEVVERTGET